MEFFCHLKYTYTVVGQSFRFFISLLLSICWSVSWSTHSFHSFPLQRLHIYKWNLLNRFILIRSSLVRGMIKQFLTELCPFRKILLFAVYFHSWCFQGRVALVFHKNLLFSLKSLSLSNVSMSLFTELECDRCYYIFIEWRQFYYNIF